MSQIGAFRERNKRMTNACYFAVDHHDNRFGNFAVAQDDRLSFSTPSLGMTIALLTSPSRCRKSREGAGNLYVATKLTEAELALDDLYRSLACPILEPIFISLGGQRPIHPSG